MKNEVVRRLTSGPTWRELHAILRPNGDLELLAEDVNCRVQQFHVPADACRQLLKLLQENTPGERASEASE